MSNWIFKYCIVHETHLAWYKCDKKPKMLVSAHTIDVMVDKNHLIKNNVNDKNNDKKCG